MENQIKKTKKARIFLYLFLLIISIENLLGQSNVIGERDISIHFRVNSYFIDKTYMNNSKSVLEFKEFISSLQNIEQIDSIIVNGTCSVEGAYKNNSLLATRRAESVKSMILSIYPNINKDIIKLNIIPENWNELVKLIEKDDKMPYQNEALNLINTTFEPDRKESLLRNLHFGRPWSYIKTNYLPLLRSSNSALKIIYKKTWVKKEKTDLRLAKTPIKIDTLFIKQKDTLFVKEIVKDTIILRDTLKIYIKPEYELKPLFALKTNLLYDAATALNVELEVPIGKKWSIGAEWIFPWWLLEKDQYCLELLNGNLEARYWLGNREKKPILTGWFLGAFAGAGLYDLEWKDKGYQGEFITAGLSGGFAHTINKKGTLRMEYSLGVGYLRTDFNKYVPKKCFDNQWHLICTEKGTYNWFGPIKAKVSIVWLLNKRVIKKGGK